MGKRIIRTTMGSCYLIILWLLLRRRLIGIVWCRPFHFLGILPGGLLIHFTTTKRKDRFAPFWYEGMIEVRRSRVPGRRVVATIKWR